MTSSIVAVAAAHHAKDFARALELALAEWRQTRAPELADAIDRLDAAALEAAPALRARSQVAFQAAWLAAGGDPDPVITGQLAATLRQKLPLPADYYGTLRAGYVFEKYVALLDRFAVLEARAADPRIARALVELVSSAPYNVWHETGARLIYGNALDLIVRIGDRRAGTALAELAAAPRAETGIVRAYLATALPEAIRALAGVPIHSTDAERAAWSAFAAPPPPRPAPNNAADGAALLARIREHPEDDAARLVYADWLIERGEPLGDLIALQLRGETTRDAERWITAILRAHQDEWLGELGLVLRGIEFERGFLTRAELAQNAAATAEVWARAPHDPRLATIAELRVGRGNQDHYADFVCSPAMRALSKIEIPTPAFLGALLARGAAPGVRHLDFKRRPRRGLLERFVKAAALPAVRSFGIPLMNEDLDALLTDLQSSGVLRRVRELALWPVDRERAALCWAALPQLEQLTCYPSFRYRYGWSIANDRDETRFQR